MFDVFCIGCHRKYNLRECYTLCPICQETLHIHISDFGSIINTYNIGGLLKQIYDNVGNTKTAHIEEKCYAKLEYMNPTGSFKDRGSLIELGFAIKHGYTDIVCASTGNMAVSLSFFASHMGINIVVFVPSTTPAAKIEYMKSYGATVELVNGNYDICHDAATQYAYQNHAMLCGDFLLRRVGQSICGLEVLKDEYDYIVIPVGNGTLCNGIIEYYMYHQKNSKKTTFVLVQGEGSDPIYQARHSQTMLSYIENPSTIGDYFKVGKPLEGNLTLKLLEKYKGICAHVSDKEMLIAYHQLSDKGHNINTTASSTYARYCKNRTYLVNKKVCCLFTGL